MRRDKQRDGDLLIPTGIIQDTPATGLSDEQNAAASDMEWELTKLIEVLNGECVATVAA